MSTSDKAEIDRLFRQLAQAHADHDADGIIDTYARTP
jgi:hypothetical protein